MMRSQTDIKLDYYPAWKQVKRIETDLMYSFYFHEELEWSPLREQFDIIGTDFIYHTSRIRHLWHHNGLIQGNRGQIGIQALASRTTVGGFTFTPPANEYALAFFTFQELKRNDWILQAALRYDWQGTIPDEARFTTIGHIRNRTFSHVSGGFNAAYRINRHWTWHAGLMKTVRIPSMKELFSEGPHLPAYSYETGDPDLRAETGWGLETGIGYASEHAGIKLSAYQNTMNRYLYPRNTGTLSVRRPLPVYQYTGADAIIRGIEFLSELHLSESVFTSATVSYVVGMLRKSDEFLPFIPPLTGKVDLQYAYRNLTVGVVLRGAAKQNKLGEFEEPTGAYLVSDSFVQYYRSVNRYLHTVSFTLENITDSAYRMHLSRVKSIMPEPGRNAKLLYRVYF